MMMFGSRRSGWWFGALTGCFGAAAFTGCAGSGAPRGEGTPAAVAGVSAAGAAGRSVGVGGSSELPSSAGSAGWVAAAGAAPAESGAPGLAGSAGSVAAGGSSGGALGAAGSSAPGGASGSSASGGASGSSASGGAAGAASACPVVPRLTGGQKYCSNTTGNTGGNYAYELWAEGNGTGCMNVYGKDAAFGATWTNVDDFLARIGLGFDRTKTHTQIGMLSADFAETKTGGETGLVYVGIYGWTVEPLREYYILEDWGTTKPAGIASDGTPRDSVGTITVDGAVYDVWKKTRVDKPAITGDHMTFDQYFSIRQTPRQCGHISISQHFNEWVRLGLQLGKLVESKLLLEAQDASGSIEFTTAKVVVGK
ncbi:MAG TPA: glycoside hydrolase family 11 protein [Polyangiaceae bacterium]|nr:glycoside hydrolase family 11 protein [Polyangiaceae bacterium]